jgi:hypothetical protein
MSGCDECLWHIMVMGRKWKKVAYAMTKRREQAESVLEATRDLATDAEMHLCCDQWSDREEECYVWTPETGWQPGAWP